MTPTELTRLAEMEGTLRKIAAECATRERVLDEAARKAEHSCYDYANTIEPSINDDGSKAFGFGFDYACEVIAAAIRAMKYDEGEGTCLCFQRCYVCTPAKLTPEEQAQKAALQQVLKDALASEINP